MLESLGNLGDFIGGIAVVVTLVYLATQIRQNTAALQTASRQAISDGYRASNRLRLDPQVGRAWVGGLTHFPDMPFDARHMFSMVMNDESLFFQGAYALYDSGQLDESTYQAYLGWISAIVSTPGGAAWWDATARPIYAPEMVAAVDARLERGGIPDIRALRSMQLDPPQEAELLENDPARIDPKRPLR